MTEVAAARRQQNINLSSFTTKSKKKKIYGARKRNVVSKKWRLIVTKQRFPSDFGLALHFQYICRYAIIFNIILLAHKFCPVTESDNLRFANLCSHCLLQIKHYKLLPCCAAFSGWHIQPRHNAVISAQDGMGSMSFVGRLSLFVLEDGWKDNQHANTYRMPLCITAVM